MFFSSYILTKKGPLAKVWLAAHWEKKLTKDEIQLVDLKDTVVRIVDPPVPISCRTQGELLLGCTRIYCKKVDFLVKASADALVIIKPPKQDADVVIPQTTPSKSPGKPGAPAKAGANVTIPVGVNGLIEIPELASFNVADMIGSGDEVMNVLLKGAEDFIPDDWFQQTNEFRPMTQLPPYIEPSDIVSPHSGRRGTSTTSGGVDQGRERGEEPDLLPFPPDSAFPGPEIIGPIPDQAGSEPKMPSPGEVSKMTPGTELPEKAQKPVLNKDENTRLLNFGQIMRQSSALVRQFVPVPPTEEALGCKQDTRLNPTELIRLCEPMRKRKLDLAFGDNVYNIGRTPEVMTEEEKKDKEAQAQRKSVFQQVIGSKLTELADEDPEPMLKGYMAGSRTPAASSMHSGGEMLMPDIPLVPDLDFPPQVIEEIEPMVDPAISAKETLSQLRGTMKGNKPVPFTDLAPHKETRAAAATRFMDVLFLAGKSHISLEQKKPYSEILIKKGERFDDAVAVGGYTAVTPVASTAKRSRKSKS